MVSRRALIKSTIKLLEMYLRIANAQGKKHGPEAAQISVVFDMEGFNLRQYMWRPGEWRHLQFAKYSKDISFSAGEVVVSLIQMYEANYPEILKTCYIVNAPKVFAFAYTIAKKFMNEYTISKIQIFKNEPSRWKKAVLCTIPLDQLPAHFGGDLTDSDGNPRLLSKVAPFSIKMKFTYEMIARVIGDKLEAGFGR